MPVTDRLDVASGLIHTRCAGETTLPEVLDHFRVLSEDPQCPAPLDVLLDLSEVGTVPMSGQLREVAGQIARVRDRAEAERWLDAQRQQGA